MSTALNPSIPVREGGTPPGTAAPADARPVRVGLRGHEPRPGRVSLTRRSRAERAARTLLFAVLLPPSCVVAFLIPPHGEPLALALFGGLYLMYRSWTTWYIVRYLDAACPRCGAELRLKKNARMKRSLELPCYSCHFHPHLELD